jgi:hypothetical protein
MGYVGPLDCREPAGGCAAVEKGLEVLHKSDRCLALDALVAEPGFAFVV